MNIISLYNKFHEYYKSPKIRWDLFRTNLIKRRETMTFAIWTFHAVKRVFLSRERRVLTCYLENESRRRQREVIIRFNGKKAPVKAPVSASEIYGLAMHNGSN